MIQARELMFAYDASPLAIVDVSFEIGAGEVVSIVGPSGCGKSTLLRLIAGLLQPTSGVLTVSAGEPMRSGFVFQDPTLLPWRTVDENVGLPLELAGVSAAAIEQAVADSVSSVGLAPGDRSKFPRMLSGGMRMRVSLARMLVDEPQVLLFDEPFAALDDLLRQRLNELVMTIWMQRRPTAVFVTHNLAEAVFLSQRVLFMSQRPGAIASELAVPFEYPRGRELRTSSEFAELLRQASAMLEQAASMELAEAKIA
jgi:NitT/TauT family transport system ATP-binding protein